MAQSWGGGASGVVPGLRLVTTVEEVCEPLTGMVGVESEFPGVRVALTLETPEPGEEQLTVSKAINRQTLPVKQRGNRPARRG